MCVCQYMQSFVYVPDVLCGLLVGALWVRYVCMRHCSVVSECAGVLYCPIRVACLSAVLSASSTLSASHSQDHHQKGICLITISRA